MSTRNVNCLILVCDGCDQDYAHDFTPHFDTAQDAREEAINNAEWRTDGEHDWCGRCQLTAHDCAPEDDGDV